MTGNYQDRFLRYAPRDGSTMQLRQGPLSFLHVDLWLLIYLCSAMAVGLIMLYSASDFSWSMVVRQAISFLIALLVMLGMAQVPPKVYQALAPYFYGFSVGLLILVMAVGEVRMGAKRWIGIPGFGSVQPSEFLKLGMPLMTAWLLVRGENPPSFKNLIITFSFIALPVLLIAEQPDLGTAILIAASGSFVVFLAGISWWYILGAVGALAATIPIIWSYFLHDYQKKRVLTLIDPEQDALGSGWNILQSITAIGSGGVSGKGYLQGTQSHLHFLPEGHTDFIIAAFSEEFGLMGIALLLIIYLLIIGRSLTIAARNKDNFGRLVVGALALSFFVYVFVNAGMVSGILPVVGVPLPFISYGGTALITLMAGFGYIMSIATHK